MQTSKLITRVRGRRVKRNPAAEPPSFEDTDDPIEILKSKFGFWADFLAASNNNADRKNIPAMLIQQDSNGRDKKPVCVRVSIEKGKAETREERQGMENMVPPTPLPVGAGPMGSSQLSGYGSARALSPKEAEEEEREAPVFIQIIHAFDATRYIIQVAEGKLIIQDVNLPLEHQKSKLDKRRLMLMQTEDTSSGQQMRACTLMFSSPSLRKVFRKLCAEHGYKQEMADMVSEDGLGKKKWKFVRSENGSRVLLGKGSFGRVFKGQIKGSNDRGAWEVMAVKELIHYDSQPMQTQFQNEIRTLNQLHHPNIIKIFGSDNSPDTGAPCILLEMVQGGDISDLIKLYV